MCVRDRCLTEYWSHRRTFFLKKNGFSISAHLFHLFSLNIFLIILLIEIPNVNGSIENLYEKAVSLMIFPKKITFEPNHYHYNSTITWQYIHTMSRLMVTLAAERKKFGKLQVFGFLDTDAGWYFINRERIQVEYFFFSHIEPHTFNALHCSITHMKNACELEGNNTTGLSWK